MDTKREFMRVLASSQEQGSDFECNPNSCKRCVELDCQWCDGTPSNPNGICKSRDECIEPIDSCPSVGTDAIMTNVSGLIVAMLAIVICLNVLNRCSNKRRRYTRKKSIFKLPVYRYPSREQSSEILMEAPQPNDLQPPESINDVEDGGLHAEENCTATCTICLSPYQNEELIKVLPCKHEFHADCLDRWLERKANCPLCKAHAFSKKEWGRSWSNTNRSHQARTLIPPVRDVANGFARGLRLTSRSTYRDRQNPAEDTAAVRSMSPGTERGTVHNLTQGAAFVNADEPTPQEVTREEMKTAYGCNDEGSAEVARAGDCHREMIDGENRYDATLAENRMGTQRAPQPPSSGLEGGRNTARRIPLVENNQYTTEEANALG